MAITTALCTSFKQEILDGVHESTDTYKIALYVSTATLGASTTAYSATDEISGTGYTAGGATLTGRTTAVDGTTAYIDWSDPVWTTATFTAAGCLIYNSSKSDKAVAVFDFGGDNTVVAGTFTVQLPTPDGTNAIVRIA